MTYFYHGLALFVVFALVIFAVVNNAPQVESAVAQAEVLAKQQLAKITSSTPAGDVIEVFENEPTVKQEKVYVNEETGENMTKEQMVQIAVLKNISAEDIIILELTGASSFGFTTQYKNVELAVDYYQIGNPIVFNGKLKKVIPNSCEIDSKTDLIICDYIEPALFGYTFTISCEYRDFCSLSNIHRRTQDTNNDGTWSEKVHTSGSGGWVEGEYVMEVVANSEAINPETDRPYLITISKTFNLVN